MSYFKAGTEGHYEVENNAFRPVGVQIGSLSAPQSMPDSGIDPDDVSVASSVTDYLAQIGVTPNKVYFSSNIAEV